MCNTYATWLASCAPSPRLAVRRSPWAPSSSSVTSSMIGQRAGVLRSDADALTLGRLTAASTDEPELEAACSPGSLESPQVPNYTSGRLL